MKINIIVLDGDNKQLDELVVEMSSSITTRGVIEGVKRYAPDLLPEKVDSYSVSVEPPPGTPLSSKELIENSRVIIKPSLPDFRIISRRISSE